MKAATIKNVIFNPPTTIVFWSNGDKTVVKCDKTEEFDPEKGMAMAISKHVLGNKGAYYNEFVKYAGKYSNKMLDEKLKVDVKSWNLYYDNAHHEYVTAIRYDGKNYEEISDFLDSIKKYNKQTNRVMDILIRNPTTMDLLGIVEVGDWVIKRSDIKRPTICSNKHFNVIYVKGE